MWLLCFEHLLNNSISYLVAMRRSRRTRGKRRGIRGGNRTECSSAKFRALGESHENIHDVNRELIPPECERSNVTMTVFSPDFICFCLIDEVSEHSKPLSLSVLMLVVRRWYKYVCVRACVCVNGVRRWGRWI